MKIIFDLDMDKCVGCGACAVACMDQNDLHPENGDKLFRNVGNAEHPVNFSKIKFLSIGCMHCDDAPCIASCPCNVFKKNERGITIYDNSGCIGCHSCLLACPYGAPTFGASGKMQKCDGCESRIDNGLLPACVRICPTGALTCMEEEEDRLSDKTHSLRKMMKDR